MNLSNPKWKTLKGGYKISYDASFPLRRLESADDPNSIKDIFKELWGNLHHQGDVGIASYYAVPQLVRIAIEKDLLDWNLLGICASIEQQRHWGDNPALPVELEEDYAKSLVVP